MKKLFVLLMFMAAGLSAQETTETKTTEPATTETPASAETEKEKGKIGREDIVVEGRDEILFRTGKSDTLDILEQENDLLSWKDPENAIPARPRQKRKDEEKKAEAGSYYGSYHTFGNDFTVARRDEYGTYLLRYRGEKYDAEGTGENQQGNSLRREDSLMAMAGFDISPGWNLLAKASYRDVHNGLQDNSLYSEMFRRGANAEILQNWNLGDKSRVSASLSGEHTGSTLELSNSDERINSLWNAATAAAGYEYSFSSRNALFARTSLSYGEKNLPDESSTWYRYGRAEIADVFPLFRRESGNAMPWHVDIKVGAGIFYGQGIHPYFLPMLAVSSYYGRWTSRLLFDRQAGYIPEQSLFLEKDYMMPQAYGKPYDYFRAALENRYGITRTLDLLFDGGVKYFYALPEKKADSVTGLYYYDMRETSIPFAKAGLEQEVSRALFYTLSLSAEIPVQEIENHSLFEAELGFEYSVSRVTLLTDFAYSTERKDGNLTVDQRAVWNAGIDYRATNAFSFFARAENLLNQEIREVALYERSGFKAMAGMRLHQ